MRAGPNCAGEWRYERPGDTEKRSPVASDKIATHNLDDQTPVQHRRTQHFWRRAIDLGCRLTPEAGTSLTS